MRTPHHFFTGTNLGCHNGDLFAGYFSFQASLFTGIDKTMMFPELELVESTAELVQWPGGKDEMHLGDIQDNFLVWLFRHSQK